MDVPITRFRRELFELADRALKGEAISVTYKGERLRLVPESTPRALFDKATALKVVNPDYDGSFSAANRQIMSEMEKEWEQDWSEL